MFLMAEFTVISYHDPKVGAWTVPQFIPGNSTEAWNNFVEGIARVCKAGKIQAQSEGLEAYRIGCFDDNTGVVTPYTPVHLIDLVNTNA